MKSLAAFFAAAALVHSSFAAQPQVKPSGSSALKEVPGVYVVELENSGLKRGASPHDAFYAHLAKRGVPWKVRAKYDDPGLFVGTSVQLSTASDVIELVNAPGVVSVRPATLVPAPKPVKIVVPKASSDPAVPPDTQSAHKMIGVAQLHNEGYYGKGIKVGIIDTGVDYKHPNLGNGLGKGKKIAGGYDFVGDDYTGTNSPVPDNDPMDCAGHGTHVAGIVGASGSNTFNLTGAAPEASIYAYRVFGCNGSTTDDVIISALLRGNQDGMDIITLSLGGTDGWTSSSASVVASRLSAAGKVVTLAAGNEGAEGAWFTASPASGIDSIAVGSVENNDFPVLTLTVHGVDHEPITYASIVPLNITAELPIYALDADTSAPHDACGPLPADTPDLSGYVVIIRRGTCAFTDKIMIVQQFGAKAVLFYNNVPGIFGLADLPIPAAMISAEDGAFLVNSFFAKKNVTLSFPQDAPPVLAKNPEAGLMSSFSTYGPTYDMYLKPAISAPGGNIISTFPTNASSFAVLSGTSMATPAVAGAAALILEYRGKTKATALGLRDLLQTTASPVSSDKSGAGLYSSLAHQGGGLINAYNAAHAGTIVTPGQFLLNDTNYFKGTHKFTIKNSDKVKRTYNIKHVAAGTLGTVDTQGIFTRPGPVPLNKLPAKVKFSTTKVTLKPGAKTTITCKFTAPPFDPSWPVYSGWIVVEAPSVTRRIAYMGVAGKLRNKQVVDNTDSYFGASLPALVDAEGFFIPETQENSTFTFANDDQPRLIWRLAFGSPRVHAHIVSPSLKVNTTLSPRGEDFFPWFPSKMATPKGSFNNVKTIGPLARLDFLPRNAVQGDGAYYEVEIPNKFANGTKIENGSYKILFRALRISGDPSKQEHYETWLSPTVIFKA